MQHSSVALSNGLRIIHVPMPAMRSVTIAVFVRVGSRYESAAEAGLSHLIEHMLFKGTARRPSAARISETIETVGGMLNASTEKELTAYWVKVAREHVALGIDLLADMVRNSKLAPAELAKEKGIIAEELNMLADDPQDWVHVLADEVLWPRQPVGREIAGTRTSLEALARKDLRRYLDHFYGPNNAVVGVAGGVDLEDTLTLIEEHFGDWAPVRPSPPSRAYFPDGAPRSRVEWKPTEQLNLCVMYPGLPSRHPDRWVLDLLCTILGGGASSRLFVRLREQLGLAYDVQAYTSHLDDTGSIVVYAGVDAGKTERVLEALFREIEHLQGRRVPETELRKVQQYSRGRLWLGLEDTHAVAGWFGGQAILHDEIVTPEEVADIVDCVTADDLRRIARTYLRPEDARLVAVGPVSGLGLEARLAGA